jgi:hypothetical protein
VNLKYVGRLLLDNEEGCTWRPIPASHTPLHFRGQFLPVSCARKVLFCTFKFLCIFETMHKKHCYIHLLKFVGQKRKVNFVDQCNRPVTPIA